MQSFVVEHKLLVSLLLILVATLVRYLAVRYIHKLPRDDNDLPRRWSNGIRNIMTTLVVVGLIVIWLSELRFLALSIATFTVALIIASREFIQCFLGTLYQASTRPFSIGDWIKIGLHTGEVASSDWLTTKILEIDVSANDYSYTGKTIAIPNNQFFTNPVYNLNFMRRYVSHTFEIIREADQVNVVKAKQLILDNANHYCEPFHEVAQRYSNLIEKRLGVEIPGPNPSVRISTTELGKNRFIVTIFCPTTEAVEIEQKLTDDFMEYWYQEVASSAPVVSKRAHVDQ